MYLHDSQYTVWGLPLGGDLDGLIRLNSQPFRLTLQPGRVGPWVPSRVCGPELWLSRAGNMNQDSPVTSGPIAQWPVHPDLVSGLGLAGAEELGVHCYELHAQRRPSSRQTEVVTLI